MRYIIIRNEKSDKFTMHASTCRVTMKHYGASLDAVLADEGYDSHEATLAGLAQYADECGWESVPKVTICNCAK